MDEVSTNKSPVRSQEGNRRRERCDLARVETLWEVDVRSRGVRWGRGSWVTSEGKSEETNKRE